MKKVVATTMATLLFGLSFPVNTFALPDNEVSVNSQIIERLSLSNSGEASQSLDGSLLQAEEDTIAKKIGDNLEAEDISVWQNDTVNWKDGVKLKTDNAEFKGYLEDASVTDLDNRNTNNSNTDTESDNAFQGRLKVTFKDQSVIEIANQKLYVTSKMTSVGNDKAPKNAVVVKLQLGEGVKDSKGTIIGNKDKPVEYGSYRIKPGVNILNEIHPQIKKSLFELVNIQVSDAEKYVDPQWKSESADGKNFVVSENNKIFTATASKLFTMTFKFVGFDKDSKSEISYDKMPESIKDKLPQVKKIKEGQAFEPEKFGKIIEKSGKNKYEWNFSSWNPTRSLSVSENKNFEGTWTRSKVVENSNSEVKPSPGKKEDKKERPQEGNKPKDNSREQDNKNKNNSKSYNYFPRIKSSENKNNSNKNYTRTSKEEPKKETTSKAKKYTLNLNSGEYEILINGKVIKRQMDVKPLIKNDRLMLPMRNLAEMIGAKVEWDSKTRTASFTNNGLVAKIQIDGNEIVLSNGKVIKMDSKPLNINGRILLSVSYVANVFGLTNGNTKDGIDQNIEWNSDNKTVEINLNK